MKLISRIFIKLYVYFFIGKDYCKSFDLNLYAYACVNRWFSLFKNKFYVIQVKKKLN